MWDCFQCPTLFCSSPYETGLSQIRKSVPHETGLSHKTTLHNTFVSNMRLVCPIWYWSALCHMSHIILLFPIWDWSIPDETGLSQMTLVCPRWDWSVPHETALCHMRLLCPTLDCSFPYETGLSQMILVCPTWDCIVPCEIASYVFCKSLRFLSSLFYILGIDFFF